MQFLGIEHILKHALVSARCCCLLPFALLHCVCVCVCVCVCTCISVCMLPPFCVGLYRVIPNSRCILKICTHPCLFWLNIWVFQSPQNTMPHLLGDPSSVASASPSPLLPQRATYRVRGDPKGPRMLEIHTDGLHTMQTCCM